ncbi:MAG: DUF4429 domain-containing protein [Cyanobacteria bacterium J06581_3]
MSSQQAPDILRFAKEGNPKAIAALMNRQFKSRGINTKAAVKGNRLDILLEAISVPEQKTIIEFIGKGLTSLSPNGISSAKVFARETGEDFFEWEATFNIPFELSKPFQQPGCSENNQQLSDRKTDGSYKKAYGALGKNGQIKLTKKRIIIYRKGFWGFVAQGVSGGKEIPISRITAVQFKGAGGLTTGFLQLSILGGIESTGGVFNAANDENTVLFETHQQKDFEEVKRYIDSVIDEEPIDFQSLNLMDFEAVEEERVEKQKETETKIKKFNDEQLSFSTRLDGDTLLSMVGGAISFLAIMAISTGESVSLGGLLFFVLGLIMVSKIWQFIEQQAGFHFSLRNRAISGAAILLILFLLP